MNVAINAEYNSALAPDKGFSSFELLLGLLTFISFLVSQLRVYPLRVKRKLGSWPDMGERVNNIRLAALGLLVATACAPPQSTGNPLVGAWLIVETTTVTADSSWINSTPEPGLYVFTESHFSNMLIRGDPSTRAVPANRNP